jgi:membrane-associated PAP2 superfamily phosphatase
MNRTGLFIALGLVVVIGLLFGIYPELDLKLAALFYDAATQTFPLKLNSIASFARDAAMWIAWAFALPAIAAIVVKLVWPERPMLIGGRAAVFLAGHDHSLRRACLTNLTFGLLGPAAPVVVSTHPWRTREFDAWWDPRGTCGR